MSKKKITPQEIQKLKDDYWEQMNILNGNDALYDAVRDYVTFLEKNQTT
jgi:hypothetical protein